MIQVTVKIGGGLCGINKHEFFYHEVQKNTSVEEFLTILSEHVGDDVLKPTVIVVLNGVKLSQREIRERKLEDRDMISLFGALVWG